MCQHQGGRRGKVEWVEEGRKGNDNGVLAVVKVDDVHLPVSVHVCHCGRDRNVRVERDGKPKLGSAVVDKQNERTSRGQDVDIPVRVYVSHRQCSDDGTPSRCLEDDGSTQRAGGSGVGVPSEVAVQTTNNGVNGQIAVNVASCHRGAVAGSGVDRAERPHVCCDCSLELPKGEDGVGDGGVRVLDRHSGHKRGLVLLKGSKRKPDGNSKTW